MARPEGCLALLALLPLCSAVFYLPGAAPVDFKPYQQVKLYASKLTSTKTQVPYDFYSLPFCRHKHPHMEQENLGERLSGDKIESSVYKLHMKVPKACEVACSRELKKAEAAAFQEAIDQDYRVHFIVDNLPVGMIMIADTGDRVFTRGFPVGFAEDDGVSKRYYLFNHLRIVIQYNDGHPPTDAFADTDSKIVGFRVEPYSIQHTWMGPLDKGTTVLDTCNAMVQPKHEPGQYMEVKPGAEVLFTYDVFWERDLETEWSHRWDVYLTAKVDSKVHWFSITNSTLIVLFLTVMIAMILVRTLRRDIAAYNDPVEEAKEESGWKLVHADVFRPPRTLPMLFSVLVGSGAQLFYMSLLTLTFALLGFLSPANRGSLVTALILLFVFMGSAAGYCSSRVYKMFRGVEWKHNTLMTAFLFPGCVFAVYFVLNVALWSEGSSGALPFSTFFTLLFLWFGVSVPLVFVGSFFGYKKEAVEHPVRTNQIPRQIPPQPWFMHPALCVAFGGVLPFGAVSVECFFLMSSVWLHQIYYIFGFLFLVMLILIATCAEVTILLCYFQLVNEDYRWWWRSFLTSGACAGYLMLYAVWYHMTELDFEGPVALMLYYGYMALTSLTFFLITGTIGFYACFWFNTKIFGSLKVD